jgi:hypothetical protein
MKSHIMRHIQSADASTFATGLAWYDLARAHVASAASDAGMSLTRGAIGAFAALSPRVTYRENVRLFGVLLSHGPARVPALTANVESAVRCLEDDAFPAGRKVGAFARCIAGDSDAVCIDTWAMRAAGVKAEKPSPKVFARIEKAYRAVAREIGVTPCQAQAIAWCSIRGASF